MLINQNNRKAWLAAEEKELTVISQMTVSLFNRFVELGNVDWLPLSIAHGMDFFLFHDIFALLPR